MHRYLDPASSLGEILFGLIMTLTFTLGAGIIIEDEGREGARQLLIAVIGCNLAWGIIDGAPYLVAELFNRSRRRRLAQTVRSAPDEGAAMTLVASELDELLENVTSADEREALYTRIAANLRSWDRAAEFDHKADLLGAFTSFWLVVSRACPPRSPFSCSTMLDSRCASRMRSCWRLLFITGYWAGDTLGGHGSWDSALLIGGVVLVVVAIALGG